MVRRLLLRRLGPLGMAITASQAALAARDHWKLLTPAERDRLQALLRQTGGRRSNLSADEQRELGGIVRKLELGALGRRVVTGRRAR